MDSLPEIGQPFRYRWVVQAVVRRDAAGGFAPVPMKQAEAILSGEMVAAVPEHGPWIRVQRDTETGTGRVDRAVIRLVGSESWLEAVRRPDGSLATSTHNAGPAAEHRALADTLEALLESGQQPGRPRGRTLDSIPLHQFVAKMAERIPPCPRECGQQLTQLHMGDHLTPFVSEDTIRDYLRSHSTTWRAALARARALSPPE